VTAPLDRIACFARDLVVQAGAGTGKTHALVTLYLHLVAGAHEARQPVAPPRIAVMTFTEKAAGELKERIRTRLGALAATPEDVARLEPTLAAAARALGVALPDKEGWTAALLALGAAPVGTFHSFAGALLRRHAARAGIDPDFKLLEEADLQARVTQAAERAILDALSGGDVAVEELVAQFGFRGVGRNTGLVELVGRLRGQRAEEGRGAAGLAGNYDPAVMARLFADAKARFEAVAEEVHAFADLKRGSEAHRLTSELAGRMAALDFTRPADVDVVLAVGKKLRGPKVTEWKRALEDAGETWNDAYHGQRAAPWAAALARLVDAVEQHYRAYKRSAGAVDFSDLLVLARDLLRDDPSVRATVRGRFDAVLVDEFQDTNPVQAELVQLIGNRQPDDERARLFVVGDRKQSIYEFRGADVAVFARAATELVERGGGEELLTQSRRSSPAVLALCNALFARAMVGSGEHEWEVTYDPARDDLSPLRADAPEWAGAELITVAPGLASEARGREARAIARRMVQLRSDGRRLGDMAMLLRRFTHVTDYLDALRAAGLPYFVVRGRGFFAAQEVRDLAAAMTVLDDPDDLLALVAVLRSPIVGVSDETLARLSLAGQLRTRVLLDPATVLPASLPQAERAGLIRFRAQFRELTITADRLGPAACAQAIVDGADLVPLLAATADGEQRVANLSRLIEKARAFESAGGDLRAFTGWLRRAAAPGGEAEAAQAQIADERDDVVRVMTVHQAKGLEFPIVFVPACGAMERVETSAIVYDSGAGLGLRLRDEQRPGDRVHTTASRRVTELRQRRERAESLRVFYVAATRARDLVVFSGERVRKVSWRGSLDELVADERAAPLVRVVAGDALPPSPLELAVAAAARQAAAADARDAAGVMASEGAVAHADRGDTTFDGADDVLDRADVTLDRAGVTLDRAGVTFDGADVTLDGADVTLDGADVTLDGADVTLDRAGATLDRADAAFDRADAAAFDRADAAAFDRADAAAFDRAGATLDRADAAFDRADVTRDRAGATRDRADGTLDRATLDRADTTFDRGIQEGDGTAAMNDGAAAMDDSAAAIQAARPAAVARLPLNGALVSLPIVDARARLQSLVTRPSPRPSSLTVAVTQLADFQLCPRRYQQFHALGLQEHPTSARAASPDVLLDATDDDAAPPLDPLRRGTLAHRLLEHAPFSAVGADEAAVDRLLAADGYDVKDAAVADVRTHVLGFLGSDFARGLDGAAVRRELPFLLSVPFDGGVLYLRGQIDLVLLQPDGVTVVDYKHARLGDPDDYRFQLDAYALAARRLYPQAPSVRTGLAFLKEADPSPQVAIAPPSEPFVDTLAALGRDLARARAVDRWDMRPLSICHRLRCGFIYRCYPGER
jgi:ATP-dependent helicase/nuclease subunit A